MIPIHPEQIFVVIFVFWFLVLGFLWLHEELRNSKNFSGWLTGKNRLFLCDKCHLTFLSHDNQSSVNRCPRCNEVCFIRRRKRF